MRQVEERKLLVIDTAFTLEAIRDRQLEHSITCRDLGGFFTHVWSVHPFATLLTSERWGPRYGLPKIYELNENHTFIEGKIGRYAWLSWSFVVNFVASQIGLFLLLRRTIKREQISVLRVSSPLYVGLFGLVLARSTGIPLVVRVGGNHDKFYETTGQPVEPRLMRSRKIEKIVEKFVFKRADLIAGANQDNLDFALRNGARPERSTLFRYGNLIDKRHFVEPRDRDPSHQLLSQLGVEPGKFLLYVGRLEAIKQPDHILEVLARVRSRGFEIKALLAGDGRMRAQLYEQAQRLAIGHAVVMPGNLDQERLSHVFAAAAVVVSPHTGRALTEAALAGAAVAAYDVDWQRELIESGATGVLVPQGHIDALSDAAAFLIENRDFARRLGRALRNRALDMLDPEVLDRHEREAYASLIRRFRPPAARSDPFERTAV